MKQLNLFVVLLLGCNISIIHSIATARETLQTIMQHIMHREKATFMRFDEEAFRIMQQSDAIGQELHDIYYTDAANHYKACADNRQNAPYPYNPMLDMAQEDINYCTRFLKLIKKYTSLVITDNPLPEELVKTLFKQGCIQLSVSTACVSIVDELTNICNELLRSTDDFSVIVTSLHGISPLLQHRLMQEHNVLLVDMDALCQVLADNKQQLIESSRFYKLMARNIIIMSTAALISGPEIYRDYNRRKAQYIKSIEVLNALGYEPYIVETCAAGKSFLDDYCHQVLYTESNDLSYVNKGVNEAISMLIFLDTYKDIIKEDDIIIKTTGRYHCADDSFIRLVEDNDNYGGFIKHRLPERLDRRYVDVFTGLFALEARYYRDMLTSMRFEHMGTDVWFEWDVARYLYTLAERHVPIMYLDKVYIYHYEGVNDEEFLG